MAITYNNLQSAINTTTLSSYTPPSLTDACLVVIVTSEDIGDNDPITSITFGGVSLTIEVIAHSLVGTNAQDVAIAYLLNPSTTSGNIVVSGSERQSIIALTLDNVDQASPIDATGTREVSSGTDLEVSAATTNANSFVVSGAVGDNDANVLTLTTGTKIISLTPSSASSAVAVSTQAISGTFSHDWVSDMSLFRAASALVAFNVEAGGGGISLTVDSGTYLQAGTNTPLFASRILQADTSSYSQVGTATPLKAELNILTTSGSYLLTGSDVNLRAARKLITETGSYSLTGTDVTLIYTPGGGGEVLVIDSGVYSLAGDELLLSAQLNIISNSGNYLLSGTETRIAYNANIVTDTGSYSLTGSNINLFANYGMIVLSTSYTLTGTSVTLKYSGDTNQIIGTVTAGFAPDLYSVGYKPNTITVTFKE